MASLYELTKSARLLNDLLESGELDEQAIRDAIVNNDEDIADKLEGYAKYIKNLESDVAGLKAEEKRLSDRRKTIENTIDRMKDAMKEALTVSGQTKVKKDGGLFTFSLRKNPPRLEIDDPEKIPERYLIPQPPTVDKKSMLEDLKNENAPSDVCVIAHLVQGESLSIR